MIGLRQDSASKSETPKSSSPPGWKARLAGLPLTGKVAVLISIPLVFQFIFVWHAAEMETVNRETHHSFWHLNRLLVLTGNISSSVDNAERGLVTYLVTGEKSFLEPYYSARKELPVLLDELDQQLESLHRLGHHSADLRKAVGKKLELMRGQLELAFSAGGYDRRQIAKFLAQKKARDDTESTLTEFFAELAMQQKLNFSTYQDSVAALKLRVVAGGITSILLVLGVALAFKRVISSRLKLLLDKTRLVAQGEQLSARMTGRDELAMLDGAIHDMADALYTAARRESALFNKLPDIIFSVDRDGKLLSVSPACNKVLGYEPAERLGRNMSECVVPEHRESAGEFLRRAISGESMTGFEVMLRHKDGSSVPVVLSGEWSETEELLYCVAHDITDMKLAEQKLSYLATFPDQNPNPIFEIDQTGQVVFSNKAGRSKFPDVISQGKAHELLRGLDEFTGPLLERGEGSSVREVALSNGSVYEQRVFYLARTGVFRVYCHDITRLKQHELSLVLAKEEAERADRAKSEFLSRMSHELRTPLNSIIGFAQLLQTTPASQRGATIVKRVEHIVAAGYHLLTLVNDVLDLSKIESGDMDVVMKDVSVERVLREVLGNVEPMALSTGIRLGPLPARCRGLYVKADAVRLRQVLLNLLTNAVKYNRPGGSVTIRTGETGEPAERMIRISVTDTGPGIPEELMEQLFKPFTRLGDQARKVDGTGIGLSIARSLVELMGGRIGLGSTVGKGTTFFFELPIGVEREPTENEFMVESELHPRATDRESTVLYVEDNPVNLELVEEILEQRPCVKMEGASMAAKGLQLARTINPDLIILDIHLPDMNGFEVLKALRSDPQTRHIPVVALTAHAMPRDIERGLELGFTQYITKPISVPRFLGVIDSLLGVRAES